MRRLFVVVAAAAAVAAFSSCLSLSNHYRHTRAVQTADDVPYIDDGDDKHRLDVYAPDGAQNVPVVVFVHGGFWRAGDRSVYEPVVGLYGNVGTALADNDVVTVVASYRLFPQAKNVDAMLDDVAEVIKWTHEHIAVHGGNPDRIILSGHSAGGHLVALLAAKPDALKKRGVDPTWIKGVAPLSGVYDIVYARENPTKPEDKTELWDPLFAKTERDESPLRWFGASMPPMLFVIGENDYKVCLHDYNLTKTALADQEGANAFFRSVPGHTHEDIVLNIGTAVDQVGPAVAAFAWFVTEPKK